MPPGIKALNCTPYRFRFTHPMGPTWRKGGGGVSLMRNASMSYSVGEGKPENSAGQV